MPDNDEINEIIQLHSDFMLAARQANQAEWMELKMTLAQIKALLVIARAEQVPISRVVEELNIGLPAASNLVNRLVKTGYAERRPNPKDRRYTLVNLAPKGRELVQRLYQVSPDHYRNWLETLTPAERQSLLAGLQALARATKNSSKLSANPPVSLL